MKKLGIITMCALCAILFASCNKGYKSFVGTWGVEKIEYYNIDYAGNPIPATIETYTYDPENIGDGIQLIFKDNKTGEMHDNNVDSVGVDFDMQTGEFDHYVYNPDTTLISTFTYSYDKDEEALYMNMKYTYPYEYTEIFKMKVHDLTNNSFNYENEYKPSYVEHAYLKRLSSTSTKSASRDKQARPHKPGSLMGGR